MSLSSVTCASLAWSPLSHSGVPLLDLLLIFDGCFPCLCSPPFVCWTSYFSLPQSSVLLLVLFIMLTNSANWLYNFVSTNTRLNQARVYHMSKKEAAPVRVWIHRRSHTERLTEKNISLICVYRHEGQAFWGVGLRIPQRYRSYISPVEHGGMQEYIFYILPLWFREQSCSQRVGFNTICVCVFQHPPLETQARLGLVVTRL